MDPQNPVSQVPPVPPVVPPVPPVPAMPPSEPAGQPVQPPPKNPLLFKLALFALLFSLVAAGIYLVWTKIIPKLGNKACTMEAKVCPDGSSVGRVPPDCEFSPCPSPSATPDETANWKTYTNTKYGYSIKFPQTWEPNRGPGNLSDIDLSDQRDVDFFDPDLPGGDPGTGLNIKVNELDATGTGRKCTDLNDCFSKTFNWLTETTTINKFSSTFLGQPAATFTYDRKTELYTQSWKYIYFIYNGNAYNINASTDTSREKTIFEAFDQILSTFKFIDQTGDTLKPTSEPSPTPTVRSFEEEENFMRKTLAGFEMYIGGRNTAGALSFFTPPQTDLAKKKYSDIRTKNLPFGLTSWSFVMDSNGKLSTEEIKDGYRVRVSECRTNGSACSILFIELVRDDSAENNFSVSRYYTTAYAYQNNLGEEIKYQGFGL